MSATLAAIRELAARDDILISAHGYDELAQDDISVDDAIGGRSASIVVEDYPDYPKGPSVLVLERDAHGRPIHVVWGIPRGANRPAVLITAYRPDLARWTSNFLERKAKR